MRPTTRVTLAAAAAACLALTATPPASAEPFEHLTFHEEFDTTNDCGDGLVLEFHDIMDGRALVVRHGDGFLYETQHVDVDRRHHDPRNRPDAHRGEQGPAELTTYRSPPTAMALSRSSRSRPPGSCSSGRTVTSSCASPG